MISEVSNVDMDNAKQFWSERVWVGGMVLAHKWRILFSVLYNKRDHINRQETRSYRMEARFLATECEDCRVPSLYDSRVLLGGISRGRSKAVSLNPMRVMTWVFVRLISLVVFAYLCVASREAIFNISRLIRTRSTCLFGSLSSLEVVEVDWV